MGGGYIEPWDGTQPLPKTLAELDMAKAEKAMVMGADLAGKGEDRTVRFAPELAMPYGPAVRHGDDAKDIYRRYMANRVRDAVAAEVSKRIDRWHRRTSLREILLRSTSDVAIIAARGA